MYEQARAMAVGNIGRMRKRDRLVPRYDWSACNTLRRLMLTFSEMQLNLFHNITIFNTREVMSYYLPHTCTITILAHEFTILFTTH